MGYQQILMVVLAVIIVGIAVAVGLTMFNEQSRNINRQSIVSDMNIFAGVANAYYKTPASFGGGAGTWDVDKLGVWFGFNYDLNTNTVTTANGTYTFSSSGDVLTIVGVGTEIGNNGSTNVRATLTLTGQGCEIVMVINN